MAENESLKIRISGELRAKAQARAESYGLSLSEYVRALLLMDVLEAERGKLKLRQEP